MAHLEMERRLRSEEAKLLPHIQVVASCFLASFINILTEPSEYSALESLQPFYSRQARGAAGCAVYIHNFGITPGLKLSRRTDRSDKVHSSEVHFEDDARQSV